VVSVVALKVEDEAGRKPAVEERQLNAEEQVIKAVKNAQEEAAGACKAGVSEAAPKAEDEANRKPTAVAVNERRLEAKGKAVELMNLVEKNKGGMVAPEEEKGEAERSIAQQVLTAAHKHMVREWSLV
jgi:hypothetical protein